MVLMEPICQVVRTSVLDMGDGELSETNKFIYLWMCDKFLRAGI